MNSTNTRFIYTCRSCRVQNCEWFEWINFTLKRSPNVSRFHAVENMIFLWDLFIYGLVFEQCFTWMLALFCQRWDYQRDFSINMHALRQTYGHQVDWNVPENKWSHRQRMFDLSVTLCEQNQMTFANEMQTFITHIIIIRIWFMNIRCWNLFRNNYTQFCDRLKSNRFYCFLIPTSSSFFFFLPWSSLFRLVPLSASTHLSSQFIWDLFCV